MKKTVSLIFILMVFVCSAFTLLGCIDQGEAAQFPVIKKEDIVYAEAFFRDEKECKIASEDVEKLVELLERVEPLKGSFNDSVYGEDYRGLNIKTEEASHHFYIYKHRNDTLLEIPYLGVYRVEEELFELLDGYLN